MSRKFRRPIRRLVIAALCLATPAVATAATINVPADQPTIQGAINAAAPGDTILVAPGTYNETLIINQADLEIISTGGRNVTTIAAAPGAAVPIVTIADRGVTLGLPNQGFRIEHQDVASTDTILINGAQIGWPGADNANPTTIAGNRFVAHDGTSAIHADAAIAETTLNIQGNVFARSGGTYSYGTPMYFESTNFGSVGIVSLYGATLRIESNVVNEMFVEAIWIREDIQNSTVVIDNNTFDGIGAGGYGFQSTKYLEEHSSLSFTNNQVSGLNHGFHLYQVDSGATLRVNNNMFDGVTDEGVYVENIYYGSGLAVIGNTIVGNGTADYGVRIDDIHDGCTTAINENDISEFDVAGIHVYNIYYSIVDIEENTIVGNGLVYGIYHYYSEAALLDVRYNDVSGYDDNGLYVDDVLENGGIYRFNSNTFEGDGTGSGMYFDDYFQYGTNVEINGNTITEFDDYGIHVNEVYENGGHCEVNNNTLTAASGGAGTTGIYWEYIESGGGSGEVVGNVIDLNGSDDDGIYFYKIDDGATLLVDDNSVTGYRRYGLYFDDYIEYGATCLITNNTFEADPATGSEYGIYISDLVEYGADLLISSNNIDGFYDYGIYVDELIDGSSTTIDDNTLSARPNPAQGFGIYVQNVENGSYLRVRGNLVDVNNAPEDAMYLYYVGYGSNANISGNTCRDYRNAGLFVDDVVEYGSTLVVNDNTMQPADAIPSLYGIYIEDYVEYGSYLECVGNTVSGFTDYGIHTSYIYHSDIVCDDNAIIGDAGGADYGIYVDDEIEYGVFFSSISSNVISNIRDDGGDMAGIYVNQVYEGANLDVFRNDITAHPDGAAYGFMMDYAEYGSILDFALNTITGFDEACFFVSDYIDDGCVVTLRNNDLIGANIGIHFAGELTEGSVINLLSNNIDGFQEYGARFSQYVDGSIVNINQNWFLGGDPTAIGVRTFEDMDESALMSINDNCFRDLVDGVVIFDIFETSIATLRGNDLSGVTGAAVINENGDTVHPVDAIRNWLNGAGVVGNVNVDPQLAGPPDFDGDGVPNCEDLCQNTDPGVAVDANGCPLPPPPDDNVNDNVDNGNDNADNGNDNGGPGPQPTPGACGCGNGGLMLMPLAVIGLIGMRRRECRRLFE
ncbi:MAG: right-handed parallel beta-helix repeat-containing protein [Phycisphaerales bacterium]|nr:right-handed parallel beta-helix repeat-containing protein [Phycisphaerales bacterium]MCB9856492.1 right-handed parallel beta-helix repeat-containing protein [Phycisphaerales bacterium]MCB9863973.1 right-handed parallel beta-helix repeat-containing protein [Phycisphaerales bacterium]